MNGACENPCARLACRCRRGQTGLTIIELLITMALAAIVLGPIIGVAFLVMNRYRPTVQSAEASKQLRLFRTVLADDWASAVQIVVDPPVNGNGWPATNVSCNNDAYTVAPTKVRIAIVTSYKVSSSRLRILYRETPNGDGSVRLDRQVCLHKTAGQVDLGSWELGGNSTTGPVYQKSVLAKRVRSLVLPPTHGCNSNGVVPFPPCDVNVTVIGVDGDRATGYNPSNPYLSTAQRTTVRLHQKVGPLS